MICSLPDLISRFILENCYFTYITFYAAANYLVIYLLKFWYYFVFCDDNKPTIDFCQRLIYLLTYKR